MTVVNDLTVRSLDEMLKSREREILSFRNMSHDGLYSRLGDLFPMLGMWPLGRLTTVVEVYLELLDSGRGLTCDDARRAVLLFYGTAKKLPFDPFLHFSLLAAKFFRQSREEGMPDSFYEQLYTEDGLRQLDATYGVWETRWVMHKEWIPISHACNYSWLKQYSSQGSNLPKEFPPFDVIKRFDRQSLLAYLYFYKYFKDDLAALESMVGNFVSSHPGGSLEDWVDCLKAMTALYDVSLSGTTS